MPSYKSNIQSLLSNTIIYGDLNAEELDTLIKSSAIVQFSAATSIFQQSELGDAMYLVLQGEVLISTFTFDNEVAELAILKIGQIFGEQAILPDNSGLRSANASAKIDCELLRIPRETFLDVIENRKYLQNELYTIGRQQLRHILAQESALFRSVKLGDDIGQWIDEKNFPPGEIIFREGELGNNFYLVLWGKADVFKYETGEENIIHEIGPGGYFGELALIYNEPRSASVRATTELLTLVIDGEKFKQLYHMSPELRSHFDHVEHFYRLPKSGFMAMHSSKYMGMDALLTAYHCKSGLQLSVTKVSDKSIVNILRVSTVNYDHVEKICYEDKSAYIHRELVLHYGVLVGATCHGNWDDLGYILEIALNEKPLKKRQLSLFRLEGELRLERDEHGLSDDTIICKCTSTTRGQIKKCIAGGCSTVKEIGEETGASRVCGACGPLLIELVGQSDLQVVSLVDLNPVAEGVKSFRFKPVRGKLVTPNVGAHVNVEAEIDGNSIRRSYTLTSPTEETDFYEITVKKEEHGIFSTWLHNNTCKNTLFMASQPIGGFKFPFTKKDIIFFVAGIGITPAINFIRCDDFSNKQKIMLVLSSNNRGTLANLDELERTAAVRDNIEIHYHLSEEGKRLRNVDIEKITDQYPNAIYFICGSSVYESEVKNTLLVNKIDKKNIFIENFQPAVNNINKLPPIKGSVLLWLFSIVSVIIIAAIYAIEPIPIIDTVQGDRLIETWISDKILKQISGYCVLGIAIFSLVLSLRKRVNKFRFGRFAYWRVLHLLLGSLAVSGLVLHTGLSTGSNLNFTLVLLFSFLAVLGILSMALKLIQNKLPNSSLFTLQDKLNWLHIFISTLLPAFITTHIVAGYYF